MAREIKTKYRDKQIPVNILIDKFNRGVVTLADESLLPSNAVKSARNLIQTQDGRWSQRWGTAYYGATTGGTIVGAERFVTSANVVHLVAVVNVAGTITIKRSTDNGATWTSCTGATMTVGFTPYFIQINNFLYIANSNDSLVRYDGTTTLQTYTALTTPTGLTGTRGTGINTAATYANWYKVSAINLVGETIATAAATGLASSIARDNWKNDPTAADTQYIDITWNRVTNATRYNIYYSDEAGKEVYLDSVADIGSGTTASLHDNGKVLLNPYAVAPTTNTTTGPTFGPMELSGNRIWATKDTANPWRVFWSSTFPTFGAFSPYYDGGYVDLELGGAERPQKAVHYRDGKGGNFVTVLTSDPEGNGSIWQIDLQVVQIGNFSYTQPVPIKVVGSVGTIAPLSVVKVRNDIMFFNRKGFFTLGSKAQMLNLLSTDEISSNIRPDIRSMTGSALGMVAGVEYDAKVFYSLPSGGSTVNNVVYVNDLERRNWAGPWNFGVQRFFKYADTSGASHLLAVPVGGTQLIEIASGIPGDFGVPFQTQLTTGLIPINPRDRTNFAKIRWAYIELSHPVGRMTFTVLGTGRKGKYSATSTRAITGPLSTAGYGTYQFSQALFSDSGLAPTATSEAIVRKAVRVNKLLNNVQLQITTEDLNATYTLLTLQVKGFLVSIKDPAVWKS